jgi:hypothetical protein
MKTLKLTNKETYILGNCVLCNMYDTLNPYVPNLGKPIKATKETVKRVKLLGQLYQKIKDL